jgi:hypothetical protein
MKTNPTATYRHSGRSGHADRKSYHKTAARTEPTIEESADRLIADIQKGFAGIAGFNAQLLARRVYAEIGRG